MKVKQKVRDQILLYSEWLDANAQLLKKPKKNDTRTHDDLVAEYCEYREAQ